MLKTADEFANSYLGALLRSNAHQSTTEIMHSHTEGKKKEAILKIAWTKFVDTILLEATEQEYKLREIKAKCHKYYLHVNFDLLMYSYHSLDRQAYKDGIFKDI